MTETHGVPDRCMVGTNVLVYATIDEAPRCEEAREWMAHLQNEEVQLCTTPQIYREYLVVLTRGVVFERSFTAAEALKTLERTENARTHASGISRALPDKRNV